MSTWKDREKVGNMIEDCARGNLPVDDALDIIESLVNESTPTNTPTSKCCLICSGYGLTDCRRDKDCPCHTPTTDFKNSNDMTTPKHTQEEFQKKWQPYSEWFGILDTLEKTVGAPIDARGTEERILKLLEETLIRIKEEERKRVVDFIDSRWLPCSRSETLRIREILQAALNSSEKCCAINPDTGETPSHCSNHQEDN